jgi:hypothetical protein
MAFFTRRGTSSVPEYHASNSSSNTPIANIPESKEDDYLKQLNYVLDREGVEV